MKLFSSCQHLLDKTCLITYHVLGGAEQQPAALTVSISDHRTCANILTTWATICCCCICCCYCRCRCRCCCCCCCCSTALRRSRPILRRILSTVYAPIRTRRQLVVCVTFAGAYGRLILFAYWYRSWREPVRYQSAINRGSKPHTVTELSVLSDSVRSLSTQHLLLLLLSRCWVALPLAGCDSVSSEQRLTRSDHHSPHYHRRLPSTRWSKLLACMVAEFQVLGSDTAQIIRPV